MEAVLKTIATMLFGAVTVVGACFIGAAAATYILAMPEGQHFANLDAPDLWTSVPEPVDPRSQKFERVEALVSAAYPIKPTAPKSRANLAANSASDGVSSDAAEASLRREHGEWCVSRYRSCDPAGDTYRAYSGQIRTCVSPFAAPSMEVTGSVSGSAGHAAWCSARYASYRVDDNTYQPYSGPRRECISPFPGDASAETASR
ncbi:BA14K family protein [Rhizobium sp. T1473]|uniref:BA14K family protein n=1 Tax=unclassified Rhizobium TaxID=2613769 RepID=UPI00296ECFCA|nr:BA14K family protein [Rhizobium sp. T1473]